MEKDKNMELTKEQVAALDALEGVFGAQEIKVGEISRHINYKDYVDEAVNGLVRWYGRYKLAASTDFEEMERLAREEHERALVARSADVRANIILGWFTSLLAKLNGAYPGGEIAFDTDVDVIDLGCYDAYDPENGSGGERVVCVSYDKESHILTTRLGSDSYADDLTSVRGNVAPREQSTGMEALYVMLESR